MSQETEDATIGAAAPHASGDEPVSSPSDAASTLANTVPHQLASQVKVSPRTVTILESERFSHADVRALKSAFEKVVAEGSKHLVTHRPRAGLLSRIHAWRQARVEKAIRKAGGIEKYVAGLSPRQLKSKAVFVKFALAKRAGLRVVHGGPPVTPIPIDALLFKKKSIVDTALMLVESGEKPLMLVPEKLLRPALKSLDDKQVNGIEAKLEQRQQPQTAAPAKQSATRPSSGDAAQRDAASRQFWAKTIAAGAGTRGLAEHTAPVLQLQPRRVALH